MFMSTLSQVVSAWFAFLLPSFKTWKALSHRPLSEPEVERWGRYWSVVGLFVAVEYVAEWFISWFPFYWEAKTLILLFLSLPQTEGSTWVYNTYLHPFFSKNEADLDAGIVAAQTNVVAFVQSRVSMLWDALLKLAAKSQSTAAQQQNGQPAPGSAGPLGFATGIWSSYGPSVMGVFQRYSAASQPRPSVSPAASQSGVRPSVTPSASAQSVTAESAPPFPEPQHFQE
ncbi:TB2/DP1, HVA22 family-domain-containing protein [Abortiporus biennis]|nr:TB2/DP1, HVA22 family-domain-containing protein [Abortiporus biennis]